jgi:hypothetical protein
VAFAPFPLPAHRTGRADFRHPALGQELTPSPTEGSWFERSSGPVPARRAGLDREVVTRPDSTACASPEATVGTRNGDAARGPETGTQGPETGTQLDYRTRNGDAARLSGTAPTAPDHRPRLPRPHPADRRQPGGRVRRDRDHRATAVRPQPGPRPLDAFVIGPSAPAWSVKRGRVPRIGIQSALPLDPAGNRTDRARPGRRPSSDRLADDRG